MAHNIVIPVTPCEIPGFYVSIQHGIKKDGHRDGRRQALHGRRGGGCDGRDRGEFQIFCDGVLKHNSPVDW